VAESSQSGFGIGRTIQPNGSNYHSPLRVSVLPPLRVVGTIGPHSTRSLELPTIFDLSTHFCDTGWH